MTTVVLFKSEKNETEKDLYQEKLISGGVTALVVPTLDFVFIELELLKEKLIVSDSYSGIIFSSPRCVESLLKCSELFNVDLSKWKDLDNFVVGEATSKKLETLGINSSGSECGNAKELSQLILKNTYMKPFLYPCGSLSTDRLMLDLNSGGIMLDSLVVYKTIPHSNLKDAIEEHVLSLSGNIVFVYFSPSGLKFSMNILKEFNFYLDKIQFVAIGPTTEEAIKDFGFNVAAVSKKPNPDCLVQAVMELIHPT